MDRRSLPFRPPLFLNAPAAPGGPSWSKPCRVLVAERSRMDRSTLTKPGAHLATPTPSSLPPALTIGETALTPGIPSPNRPDLALAEPTPPSHAVAPDGPISPRSLCDAPPLLSDSSSLRHQHLPYSVGETRLCRRHSATSDCFGPMRYSGHSTLSR